MAVRNLMRNGLPSPTGPGLDTTSIEKALLEGQILETPLASFVLDTDSIEAVSLAHLRRME